jgi:hypothetical protein
MTEIDMKRVEEIYKELEMHTHEIHAQSEDAADFADNLVRAGIELTLIKEKERYQTIFKEYLKRKKNNGNK